MHPRVLIVGTVPYNTKSTSRAFDAYFHYWEKENIVQIFSNTKKPCKGHCETLYQITDHRVLQQWLGKKIETGVTVQFFFEPILTGCRALLFSYFLICGMVKNQNARFY